MPRSLQRALPPMEVQRVDDANVLGESGGPKSGPRDMPEMSLDMAKAQIGSALRQTIRGDALKEYGDPSHVNRVCDGEIPGPLARAWQRPDRRLEFVRELAKASGLHVVRTVIEEKTGT